MNSLFIASVLPLHFIIFTALALCYGNGAIKNKYG